MFLTQEGYYRKPGALGLPSSWSCYCMYVCAGLCVCACAWCQEMCSVSLSDLVVLELFTFLNFLLSPVWVLAHHGGWGGTPYTCAETSLPEGL